MASSSSAASALTQIWERTKGESWWRLAEHAFVGAALLYVGNQLRHEGMAGLQERVSGLALKAIRLVPGGAAAIDAEKAQILEKLQSFVSGEADDDKIFALPEQGVGHDELLALMQTWRAREVDFNQGRAFGGIYTSDEEHERFVNQVYSLYSNSNALYPGVFPGLRKFEAEVVQMTASIFQGDDQVCGTMTSCGTESVLMAVKAAREYARKTKPHIRRPNIIVAQSTHPAFAKACSYFNIEMRVVPSGAATDFTIDVDAVRANIDSNTILLVGSAPSFPHGVIDPIGLLSAIALDNDISFHVDCCLGGFLLPFLRRLNHVTVPFDFSLPGVTSISADIHKYGYGPKGTSVILHRTWERRKCQFFCSTEWSGGSYVSPTATGSRPGGQIAGAWATLMSLGVDGYTRLAEKQYAVWSYLVEAIPKIPELQLLGNPSACVVAFTARDPSAVDPMKLADALARQHWHVNRLQKPMGLQLQIGVRDEFRPEEFIAELTAAAEAVRLNPAEFDGGPGAVYAMAANAPNRELVGCLLEDYLSLIYKV